MTVSEKTVTLRWAAGLAALLFVLSIVAITGFLRRNDRGQIFYEFGNDSASLARLPALPQAIAQQTATGDSGMSPDRARKLNAAQPFTDDPVVAASGWQPRTDATNRLRARGCLATAMLYEAGDDPEGQRAVAQVVLNRARHPAYPASVCGVVAQGIERRTGCQFSFTCDGSLRRRFGQRAVAGAFVRADAALAGQVYAPVGLATHYHTDWVHPYWSAKLDKVTRVGTHLFFRWKGFWGSRRAFRARAFASEPAVPSFAFLEPALAPVSGERAMVAAAMLPASLSESAEALAAEPIAPGLAHVAAELVSDPGQLKGISVRQSLGSGGAYLIAVRASGGIDGTVAIARRLCAAEKTCRVLGWPLLAQVPDGFPIPQESRAEMVFEYARSVSGESIRGDCRRWPASEASQCL